MSQGVYRYGDPPKVPGTDSHAASIADDIRSAARGLEHIAARVERLGVEAARAQDLADKHEEAMNVKWEAREAEIAKVRAILVEEKKAAVIRAAADAVELYLMDEELPADYLTPHIEALRALVEASRESASKKEDAE